MEIFKDLYLKGSVYRGRKPIHWCKRCHTALAEAEIEYDDEVSPSIFVAFKMDVMPGVFEAAGAQGEANILIWTTTPWTLPANTAVSLAPDADYVMVVVDGKNFVMALELVERSPRSRNGRITRSSAMRRASPSSSRASRCAGSPTRARFARLSKGTIIYGDHVTLDSGTGAVHTPRPWPGRLPRRARVRRSDAHAG